MSFFDQPRFALIKANASRVGIWPDQSKYAKIFRPLTILATTLTLVGPMLVHIHEVWGDVNTIITSTIQLLMGTMTFIIILTMILKAHKIKMTLEEIERHWAMFKNTPAVIILDKYAQYGRYLAIAYPIYTYTTVAFFFTLTMSPIIMDFVDPLNNTRPRDYLCAASYGVDPDKYYWFMVAHCYFGAVLTLSIAIAGETMYILLVVHACSIFKIVEFNLKSATSRCIANEKTAITVGNDCNYQKICDCILVHNEAISFAEQVESIFCLCTLLLVGTLTVIMSLTGIQILINIGDPAMLMRAVSIGIYEVFNLYLNNLPGQQLMDHSQNIHTLAYDLDWHDMPVRSQKLLILILMRSEKPCRLTAGKIYIFSIESFGTVLKTSVSYFMIFANQL